MKNWRPISLSNSDCKLLVKCIALQLSRVIGDIVNSYQVGYIKGQCMAVLLCLIDDTIDQQNVLNKPGLLITVDYFHAFVCISKDFMM